ncbi:MAG: hypothetical protein IPQ08_06390 [Chitinophagaceae bacterium]|nr:hypothetical protein [Chitinophagaceae bacterium]
MKNKIIDRVKEPSTWAGLGLVVQGIYQLYVSKGGDIAAIGTIGAGIAAIFLPEKTTYESSPLQ